MRLIGEKKKDRKVANERGTNTLLAQERRKRILEFIQEEGSARVVRLSELFEVSEPTIRQDLEVLDKQNYITREHGGAFLRTVSRQVSELTLQHMENMDKKVLIAKRAAQLVSPGDRIILDSGSTITELAKCLSETPGLVVVTNAINIALIIGANPACELMVTGGDFKAPTLSLTGEKAAAFFRNIYVDKLFLATGGVSPTLELTYPGYSDLVVKKAMIDVSKEIFLLADSTKFGKASFASLGVMDYVDAIVTDDGIGEGIRRQLDDLGVKTIVA
jgi:DeoR/GlpR family transcriptional regulator of sugar metabolism